MSFESESLRREIWRLEDLVRKLQTRVEALESRDSLQQASESLQQAIKLIAQSDGWEASNRFIAERKLKACVRCGYSDDPTFIRRGISGCEYDRLRWICEIGRIIKAGSLPAYDSMADELISMYFCESCYTFLRT